MEEPPPERDMGSLGETPPTLPKLREASWEVAANGHARHGSGSLQSLGPSAWMCNRKPGELAPRVHELSFWEDHFGGKTKDFHALSSRTFELFGRTTLVAKQRFARNLLPEFRDN